LASDLPVARAIETNMLEQPRVKLSWQNGGVALTFRPFEIKTIRLKLR
jgi:hypothetical protein